MVPRNNFLRYHLFPFSLSSSFSFRFFFFSVCLAFRSPFPFFSFLCLSSDLLLSYLRHLRPLLGPLFFNLCPFFSFSRLLPFTFFPPLPFFCLLRMPHALFYRIHHNPTDHQRPLPFPSRRPTSSRASRGSPARPE